MSYVSKWIQGYGLYGEIKDVIISWENMDAFFLYSLFHVIKPVLVFC